MGVIRADLACMDVGYWMGSATRCQSDVWLMLDSSCTDAGLIS